MAQHARIEELSDSSGDSDPPEDDIDDVANTYIRPANVPPPTISKPQTTPTSQAQQQIPPQPPPEYKHYQCIYPVYFDANRTRAEGRRVGAESAVQNPLAREIVDAVQLLGLKTVFEPGKMHPKDWANPGRVRVLVKEGGRARSSRVKNSMSIHAHLLRALGGDEMAS
jgi:signal recognition particle subunit SRP19